MAKRELKDLNLLDDFLFGSMLTYPGIGETFVRELLKTIFQREFGTLTIVPQKVYYGSNTDKHGARLDVYIEESLEDMNYPDAATVYDVEPDTDNDKDAVRAIPKRIRFYHAKIDARSLKAGQDYNCLKNVITIMIVPFDPFGLDRMVYTIQSKCLEEPDMPYDDGAKSIFLYTKGKKGNPPEELKQLLQYMEHTTKENARNESLQNIHQMVDIVKQDGEVSLEYMKAYEREQMLLRQGKKMEAVNTERERQRADAAESRADAAESRADAAEAEATAAKIELKLLKEKFGIADK